MSSRRNAIGALWLGVGATVAMAVTGCGSSDTKIVEPEQPSNVTVVQPAPAPAPAPASPSPSKTEVDVKVEQKPDSR